MTILYYITIFLTFMGIVSCCMLLFMLIEDIVKKHKHTKLIQSRLSIVSKYCDNHDVPISAEQHATWLIKNNYPLDKVLQMLKHYDVCFVWNKTQDFILNKTKETDER